jgi:hypothetical protein
MTTKKKVEVRFARGGDPTLPHVVTVEFLSKWDCTFIDVNPATVRIRGAPQRKVECLNKEAAMALAYKLRDELLPGLTQAGQDGKVPA